MAVIIPISISRKFTVKTLADEVHALLANVPESAAHFPKLEHLTDMGDYQYKWEMQKIGTSQVSIQVVYACKYASNPEERTVTWTPVPGVGNSQIRGHWKIKSLGGSTSVELLTAGEITLPLPKLLSAVAKPVVAHEFNGLVDTYIKNLTQTFGAA